MASKRKVRRRVAKALRKYVRGNRAGTRKAEQRSRREGLSPRVAYKMQHSANRRARRRALGGRIGIQNPPRVKGRKTKGGRAVTLKNFTGTIVKKSDGTVQIVGRGRRK